MITCNHTPGPWKAQQDLRSWRNGGAITDGPYAWGVYAQSRIATIEESSPWLSAEVEAANARLIAQAPALLEKAERIIRRLDNGDTIEPGWWEAEELRAVIARARGEA